MLGFLIPACWGYPPDHVKYNREKRKLNIVIAFGASTKMEETKHGSWKWTRKMSSQQVLNVTACSDLLISLFVEERENFFF